MNAKVITGGIATVIIVGGALLFLRPSAPITPTTTLPLIPVALTTPRAATTSTHSQPTIQMGTPILTKPAQAAFDSTTFTSSSTYPVVTGTASNTKKVGIVINNSKDLGLVGTWEIPVIDGHWSYAVSVALPPDKYTVLLFLGSKNVSSAKLTVTK
jgi:hypothetical protein